MNTDPDDEKLALWLDDELAGEDLAAMETTCLHRPDLLAMRAENRTWRAWMAGELPASEEPRHAEFFNARIIRTIERRMNEIPAAPAKHAGGAAWRAWLMPVAAAAGVVLGFQLGARQKAPRMVDIDVSGAPRAIPVEPILYTPEKGVRADWFTSEGADAYVIVLDGVPPIPDAVDFTRAMSWHEDEDGDQGETADFIPPVNEDRGGGS